MKVYWTDRARYRLKQIRTYLDEQAPAVAKPTTNSLVNRSRELCEVPRVGRQVPEYQQEDIREVLERPYRIIYRILSDRIDVLTVMHYRQLLPSDINDLLKPSGESDSV